MAKNPIDLTQYAVQRSIRLRFYKYIQFCEHGKACQACHWLYKPSKDTQDYGRFYICIVSRKPKKMLIVRPSRFMWNIVRGHTDKLVLHTCDIRSCVNYHHLYAGSHTNNAQDRENRHRSNHAIGEKHGRSKLTPNTIWHMKALRESGFTYESIALIVGVSDSQSYKVLNSASWKHLGS